MHISHRAAVFPLASPKRKSVSVPICPDPPSRILGANWQESAINSPSQWLRTRAANGSESGRSAKMRHTSVGGSTRVLHTNRESVNLPIPVGPHASENAGAIVSNPAGRVLRISLEMSRPAPYCQYFMGRRMLEEDRRQIKRWKAFRRRTAQIRQNCEPGDPFCRPRQRQALLHWAYDSRKI